MFCLLTKVLFTALCALLSVFVVCVFQQAVLGGSELFRQPQDNRGGGGGG